MRVEVEPESDGLGYHAAVFDLDGRRHRVPGWSMSRFGAWKAGRLYRRKLETNEAV